MTMEWIEELYQNTVAMFPDMLTQGFWVAWLCGLLCSVVLSLPRWKWLESVVRNSGVKWMSAVVLVVAIVLLISGVSWEGFFLLILPLLYFPCRLLWLWLKCRKAGKNKDRKNRLLEQYELLEQLNEKDLMRWEMKLFYFPLLKFLLDIGAMQHLEKELEDLKDEYKDCFQWKQLNSFVLFNKHRYQEMIDLLRDVVKDMKVSEKARHTVVNNLYCAFRNVGDKAGMKTCMNQLEKMVFEDKCYMLEALDNMLYYYDQNNDADGQKKVCDIAGEKMKKSLDNFIYYGDIIYMHNKRLMRLEDNKRLLDELISRVSASDIDEERKLNIGLKLIRMAFENDYKWKELSLRAFSLAQVYLDYSRDTALVYMEEVYHLLTNAQDLKGMSMPEEQTMRLLKTIYDGVGKYMNDIDNDLTELPDDFLYVKKSLLMNKVTYERVKLTIEGDSSAYLRNVMDLEKRIVSLCKRNAEDREMLHFMVVLIDDVIDYIKKTDLASKVSYMDDIRDYTEQIGSILKGYNYDPSLAYYIFYYAYFQDYIGNTDSARYAFERFKETGVDIKNFSIAIQSLFGELERKFNPVNKPGPLS